MASVLLHSVGLEDARTPEYFRSAILLFTESARMDRFGVHTLTSDPEQADIILFSEMGNHGMFAERVRHHPYAKRYREKCFLYDPCDNALPFLPGLYASLSQKYYDPARTRTGFYVRLDENPYLSFRPALERYDYLASFVGSFGNHPIRRELVKLPRDRFLIDDTSSLALRLPSGGDGEERHRFWSHYADAIAAAPFSLCPRGRGTGSLRLFETMQMGRVPVIISDRWVYPDRLDWQACSIRVPEHDILRIPEILDRHREHANEMGLKARKEWEKYYEPSVRFHWIIEDCLTLLAVRRVPERIASKMVWRFLLNYGTFRRFLTSKRQLLNETGRIFI